MKNYIIKISLWKFIPVNELGFHIEEIHNRLFKFKYIYSSKDKYVIFNLHTDNNLEDLKNILKNKKFFNKYNKYEIFDIESFKDEYLKINPKNIHYGKEDYVTFFDTNKEELYTFLVGLSNKFSNKQKSDILGFNVNEFSKNAKDWCKSVDKMLDGIEERQFKTKCILLDLFRQKNNEIIVRVLNKNEKNNIFIDVELNLDLILEKISDKGFKSLTDKEINFLNNYTDTI